MTPPHDGAGDEDPRPRPASPVPEPDLERHLRLTVLLFLTFMGLTVVAEWLWYPERAKPLGIAFAVMVGACAIGLVLVRLGRLAGRPVTIGVSLMSILAVVMASYHVMVAPPVERAALGHTALLVGLLAVMPWGWRAQLAVAVTAFLAFTASAPFLPAHDTAAFALVTLLTAAVTTVIGASHLERSRTLLRDEAQMASALAWAGHILNTHLNEPDLLERVNRLAVELLACDWSLTFVWDDARQTFRIEGGAGVGNPAMDPALLQRELPRMDLPIGESLRRGEIVEVTDTDVDPQVPLTLLARFGVSSALCVPIRSGGTTTGVLVHGYCLQRGRFTPRQHRLARGLADVTSIALGNARVIADLQAASRLKSEFVSTMSHELRTPLNVILGYSDLLRDGAFDPLSVRQQQTIERIHASAVTLLELVDATLDLNRLESGRDPVVLAPIDLGALFAELDRALEPLARDGVRLCWASDVPVPVQTDRVKLKTILTNLVGNALKFTEAGTVSIEAHLDGTALVLTVRDTGIGIAEQDLPVIFDVFRQGDGSDSRRFGGVGLGLHIVRRLVEGLGGHISVTSTVGSGSEFTIRLRNQTGGLDASAAGSGASARRPAA